jgi:hypothetical protein
MVEVPLVVQVQEAELVELLDHHKVMQAQAVELVMVELAVEQEKLVDVLVAVEQDMFLNLCNILICIHLHGNMALLG